MKDNSRTGTFSSSGAHKLMTSDRGGKGLGAPALKYIKQVRYEMKLGRSISNDFDAKETSWGTLVEKRSFRLLDTSYQYVANQGRLFHSTIKHYSGIPDFLKGLDTVADSKCPFNLEKFCDKMEALANYETFKKEFPEDFYQLISNAVLLRDNGINIKFMEAINYVPYHSEIEEIRIYAEDVESMRWLKYTTNGGLPWLADGGHYKNLNVHRFEIKEDDVQEFTERLLLCETKLHEK